MIESVDINCDMGELMPTTTENIDEQFMPYISSCNISCGAHSGDPVIMKKTIQSAIRNQVSIGAHPSYPDRKYAGRKSLNLPSNELVAHLEHQLFGLIGMVSAQGGTIYHVKAHGALYNDIAYDRNKAEIFVQTVQKINPTWKIYGLAMSPLENICKMHDMEFVSEAFADRRYESNLRLRSRKLDAAIIHDLEEVEQQINYFMNNKVLSYDKEICDIEVQSICIHSDSPNALAIAKKIFTYIKEKGVTVSTIA
jgi:UPF0271 protein